MIDQDALGRWFEARDRVLLGFSGGVDSALLAVVGARTLGPERFLAVIGRSASLADRQWEDAVAIARRFAVPFRAIATEELADERYRANAPSRCYFCKSELWAKLTAIALSERYPVVIDGSNTDDLNGHRPGGRAGTERGIRSPYLEIGWDKAAIREAARAAGLPNWDAPAAPCLASRIRYGLEVTEERLRQVELGEALLRTAGVTGDLRVRHHGRVATIEVSPEMFDLVRGVWPDLERTFAAVGFEGVELDPGGYRRGNLLPVGS